MTSEITVILRLISHVFLTVQTFLALTFSSFLSCCSRLLSKSTKEPDAGEGGRGRTNRVQAQDVSLGCGVMAKGQRPTQRKQQVTLMLHVLSSIHWWGVLPLPSSVLAMDMSFVCDLCGVTKLWQWMENALRLARKLACLTGPFYLASQIFMSSSSGAKDNIPPFVCPCVYHRYSYRKPLEAAVKTLRPWRNFREH